MTAKPSFHGSDLEKVESFYNIPIKDIINFGANVNPLGLSDFVHEKLKNHLDIITVYPDRAYTSLRNTIGNYCHVSSDNIIVGNGSTELISLLIQQNHPKKALLLGPTYSEYERELEMIGCELASYNLELDTNFKLNMHDLFTQLEQKIDLLIICNPNNPTSTAIWKHEMEQLVSFCKTLNIFVMIDETYVEFVPDINLVTAMELVNHHDNLMILRGVSKFFAAPGLRLGYGVTSNINFLRQMKHHQNPWSLNSLGALAGELMLSDNVYITKTKALISSERDRLYRELQTWSTIKVFAPFANFILLQILKPGITSPFVFEHLIKKGLMIRDCSSFKSLNGEFIRFCIMLPADNDRLLHALKEIL